MTSNYIIILGIIELLTFFAIIYLIIRANIIVNTLQQEVNELHLCVPVILRDIRQDLCSFNAELSEHVCTEPISSQKLGFMVGQIFTEIILFRLKSFKFGRKFVILSIILKAFNFSKLLKPLLLLKPIR
ncbi:MAG: hypothetical protein A2039_08320 [Candidatus Melainabacteria bacterium GWA2_34_9]|nr:MAG: hypothetical protein A2039_08320 [Candidatus Melainabacteria bacterium GWA2_34_9]